MIEPFIISLILMLSWAIGLFIIKYRLENKKNDLDFQGLNIFIIAFNIFLTILGIITALAYLGYVK